jgi:hypothetical protein
MDKVRPLICPSCHREVAALLPDRCVACRDLDRLEAEIRREFGDVTVVED